MSVCARACEFVSAQMLRERSRASHSRAAHHCMRDQQRFTVRTDIVRATDARSAAVGRDRGDHRADDALLGIGARRQENPA